MSRKAYGWTLYGLGGAGLDPAGGMALMTKEIAALGVHMTGPLEYYEVQTVYDGIMAAPRDAIIIVGGDSLGANNTPYIATQASRRKVDYIFGFQPSVWGYHSTVPANVVEALCIYNPNWFATFGLGDYPWPLADGNKTTRLHYLLTNDSHPGDNDALMQKVICNDIKRILGA